MCMCDACYTNGCKKVKQTMPLKKMASQGYNDSPYFPKIKDASLVLDVFQRNIVKQTMYFLITNKSKWPPGNIRLMMSNCGVNNGNNASRDLMCTFYWAD